MFNKQGVAHSIRTNIVVGLMLVIPIIATILIIQGLFNLVTNIFLVDRLRASEYVFLFRVAAFLAVLLLLFLIGLLTRNFIGRRLYQFSDLLLTRIPVINKVYLSIRQISEALVTQHQTMFREAVLLEYPRPGLHSMGFVTSTVPANIDALLPGGRNEPRVALFVPTTPNPTSGVLVLARRSELTPLPMSVTDAMKLLVSAGVAYPGSEPVGNEHTLLSRLENWLLQQREETSAAERRESPDDSPVKPVEDADNPTGPE